MDFGSLVIHTLLSLYKIEILAVSFLQTSKVKGRAVGPAKKRKHKLIWQTMFCICYMLVPFFNTSWEVHVFDKCTYINFFEFVPTFQLYFPFPSKEASGNKHLGLHSCATFTMTTVNFPRKQRDGGHNSLKPTRSLGWWMLATALGLKKIPSQVNHDVKLWQSSALVYLPKYFLSLFSDHL